MCICASVCVSVCMSVMCVFLSVCASLCCLVCGNTDVTVINCLNTWKWWCGVSQLSVASVIYGDKLRSSHMGVGGMKERHSNNK